MIVTQSALVMAFGAIIAGAGLLLLSLRKDQTEHRIRIKLFGQEFQLSTPALAVFLVGCAIFVMPSVLPISDHPVINIRIPGESTALNNNPVPGTITEEKEPNDQIAAANLIAVGTTVRGLIASEQDRDFFKFKTSGQGPKTPGQVPKVRIILRKTSLGGFHAYVEVYNNVENKVKNVDEYGEDSVSFAFESDPASYYYIKVSSGVPGPRGSYELEVKEE